MKKQSMILRFIAVTLLLCGAILTLSSCSVLLAEEAVDVVGESRTYDVSDNVKKLEISIAAANLEIRKGNKLSVETDHRYVDVRENGTRLVIEEEDRGFRTVSGLASVVLYLPENMELEDVQLQTGAGTVTVEALTAKTLNLDLGAGLVTFQALTVLQSAEIDGGAGRLTVESGTVANLDLEMGVGALTLACRLTGESDLIMGVGQASLALDGAPADYRITMSKGIGSATLDGEAMLDGETYGQGTSRIYLEGGVGAISVTFEK